MLVEEPSSVLFNTEEGASTSIEIFVYITIFTNILMKTPEI